jgi:HK97 family phage portal protein
VARWWQRSNVLKERVQAILEERDASFFSNSANVPSWPSYWSTSAGSLVSSDSAVGLPAVMAAIRLLAETTGMTPMKIYKGDPPDREKARDTWQWYRLHDQPSDNVSAFTFFQDIESSIEGYGNAYVWKAKAGLIRDEEDIQLIVLDPTWVSVRRENGRKKFKIGNDPKLYDSKTVLHIRGWSPHAGADEAPSPITLEREAIGGALALQEYEGRFFQNNANPGGVIEVPGTITQEKAQLMVDYFVDRHSGLQNAHKPAVLYNGAQWKATGLSQEDAQFIESKNHTIEDIARIFRISAIGMLGAQLGAAANTASDDFERFLKVDLAPRLRRIEMAFRMDLDLFGTGSELFCEFDANAILRPDIKTRYDAYRLARQGGWLTPNEIRENENLPPHELGDDILATPVGGAPNEPSMNGAGLAVASK